MISTSEDVQYEQGTSSVQAGNTQESNASSVQAGNTQESGTFSVQARMCSSNQAHHQYQLGCAIQARWIISFGTGDTTEYTFK